MLWHVIWIGGYLLSICVIPFILLSNKRPAATLAWVWAMILFPYAGPLFYLCFGSERMNRRRFRNRVKERLRSSSHWEPKKRTAGDSKADAAPDQERILIETLSTINAQPITTAETAQLLIDGAAFYDALEAAIAAARKTIHIEFFIWRGDAAGDRFRRLLVDAARRGVKVRLLLDEMGSSHLYKSYFRELADAGGAFSWFGNVHPLRNRWTFGLRNHRKLQIIDGETAFVGGMNMGCEYLGQKEELGPWHDIQVRVTGPVVAALENSFADDWYFATDQKIHPAAQPPAPAGTIPVQVVEDGPDNRQDPLSLSVLALINQAQHRLWLTTAYFVPLFSHLSALKLAAARGVDVRMLVSAKSEHFYLVEVSRSYYEELLRYGIRIFEFTEGINHGKVMAIDDRWASVGSANFDNRSMHLNFELNLAFHSPELVKQLSGVLAGYYEASQEIHLSKFIRRPFWNKLKESAFRPLGPVL